MSCKKALFSFSVGKLVVGPIISFDLPALTRAVSSFKIKSAVPLPKMALSSGSGKIPKVFSCILPPTSFKFLAGFKLSPDAKCTLAELLFSYAIDNGVDGIEGI